MKNNTSATELVHEVVADLGPLTEMLPLHDRTILGKLTDYALNHEAAIANADGLLPLRATLLILLLEEHKRTQRIYGELCAEIERLKGIAQQLQEMPLMEEHYP